MDVLNIVSSTYVPCVPKVTNVPNGIITPMYTFDVLDMIRSSYIIIVLNVTIVLVVLDVPVFLTIYS